MFHLVDDSFLVAQTYYLLDSSSATRFFIFLMVDRGSPQISSFNGAISLTTNEIATLTGKRHDHVLRDSRVMLVELYGENSLPNFGESYTASNGRSYPCYRLPKREVLVLVSGYSIKLRMKIITRLEDLEEKTKNPMMVLNNPIALRSALLTYSEKVLSLEQTVQEQSSKVAALNRIAVADGSMCITSSAKHLQIRPKGLFQYLLEHKWIYRRSGGKSYLAYQNRIQQGLLEHKVSIFLLGDGTERISEQVRVTSKGIARLSETFEESTISDGETYE